MNGLARGSEPPGSDLTHLTVTDLYRCGANSEHDLGRASPCGTGLSASLKPRLAPGFPPSGSIPDAAFAGSLDIRTPWCPLRPNGPRVRVQAGLVMTG